MAGNTIGELFRLITFGESHGPATGGVVEGCPAGLAVDQEFVAAEMARRRPGTDAHSSSRQEEDKVEFLSGIVNGITLGSPIAFIIKNEDARPEDYHPYMDVYRPSHADYTTEAKYGLRDSRGGGRASGRETAARVAGGAIAKLLLKQYGICVAAFTTRIGPHHLDESGVFDENTSALPLGCPDPLLAERMSLYLGQLQQEGDSCGGEVTCRITGVPAGLGEPVFDKLHADLGKAMLSIGTCKGFEIGSGFGAAAMRGSEFNDKFIPVPGGMRTATNHDGGTQGGISNGEEIIFRAAFKPVPSITREQQTVDSSGNAVNLKLQGRYDTCVIPRVLTVVEAMAALVIADHLLRSRASML